MVHKGGATIGSIGDYLEEVIRLTGRESVQEQLGYRWYRGHGDLEWELVPKVQRGFAGTDEELFRTERYYTNDFQARASVFQSSKPPLGSYADWLTLMQHYGLPTRLLDWSRSPLVALYFAVSEKEHGERDACVWMLSPGALNSGEQLEKPSEIDGQSYENTFIYNMAHNTIRTMIYTAFRRWDLSGNREAITPEDRKFHHRFCALRDKIAACYPTEADGRVYNQHAAFTVHNTSRKLLDCCDEHTLACIKIPHSVKEKLLFELSVCGITQSYIYPDLEHLADEIKSWR